MIDLVNLRADSCRYMPVDGLFCGKRSLLGKSWCAEHAKLIYTPSRPKGERMSVPLPKMLTGVKR